MVSITNISGKKPSSNEFRKFSIELNDLKFLYLNSNTAVKPNLIRSFVSMYASESVQFIFCNEKVFDLYGYTKEEFLNLPPYELSVEFTDNIRMENKQEDIVTKGFDRFVTKHKHKNGRVLDIYVESKRIEIEDKWLLFIVLRDLKKEDILKSYYEKTNKSNSDYVLLKNNYRWYKVNKTLLRKNQIVQMTLNERNLVELLIKNRNRCISHEQIKNSLSYYNLSYNSLLSMVKRIRKKTQINFIKSIYSKGYFID